MMQHLLRYPTRVLAPLFLGTILSCGTLFSQQAPGLKVTDQEYLGEQGLSVLLYHNVFSGIFFDQKLGGMEIILHGRRIATDGDIRLLPTPEQWDPIPTFARREADRAHDRLTAFCSYPKQGLSYRLELTAEPGGLRVAVHLDKPLPEALVGQAGFNLEFLPTAYFGKSYILDDGTGVFPRHPNGEMKKAADGNFEPLPLATGKTITLSPEDPMTRVTITSDEGPLSLYDGRNRAQNGWFVVRTLIPANRTGNAVVWHVRPNVIPGWVRQPVIGHNQVGYAPDREKVAVIELDPKFDAPKTARVLKVAPDGNITEAYQGEIKPWGKWLRYDYAKFDFSSVREPGIYMLEYAGERTVPFRIAKDIYRNRVWQPSLDTYLPIQMDHVSVREQYRIWHGLSHMDDARQAPINHQHFDGYRQGPTTDSPYKPGEHIPGLNQGGWYDAGDFDIRTPTQNEAVRDLVWAFEQFGIKWDETTVDEKARMVQIRRPDGIPDAVQQIEHGVLQILGQFKAIGHSIPGIIAPTLQQYTHLGDGGSKTDNRIYSEKMGPLETDGLRSGVPDDRWAFTNRSTPLDYLSISALAAASRVLSSYNPELAKECLATAERVWKEEHARPPVVSRSFGPMGGRAEGAEALAATELVIATKGGEPYRSRLAELMPAIRQSFGRTGWNAVRALPYMDAKFKSEFEAALREQKTRLDADLAKNPFGVPVREGATWGTAGQAAGFGTQMYFLHAAFPDIIGPEYTLQAMDYVLGTHPVTDTSWVSAVGAKSKLIAYGNNRANYTFIPGGLVPGFIVVKPDFPESKDDWPFLWFENEYVVTTATQFILLANAADTLIK
jgi:endoglucanase